MGKTNRLDLSQGGHLFFEPKDGCGNGLIRKGKHCSFPTLAPCWGLSAESCSSKKPCWLFSEAFQSNTFTLILLILQLEYRGVGCQYFPPCESYSSLSQGTRQKASWHNCLPMNWFSKFALSAFCFCYFSFLLDSYYKARFCFFYR